MALASMLIETQTITDTYQVMLNVLPRSIWFFQFWGTVSQTSDLTIKAPPESLHDGKIVNCGI